MRVNIHPEQMKHKVKVGENRGHAVKNYVKDQL